MRPDRRAGVGGRHACVVKPAEDTPLTSLRVARLALEAGLPAGVLNVVTGLGAGAGSALADHVLPKPSDGLKPSTPSYRAYRFWRDMGYALGALIAGGVADALGYGGAIALVAALTAPNAPSKKISASLSGEMRTVWACPTTIQ